MARNYQPPSRIRHFVAGEATTITRCLEKHFGVVPEQAQNLLRLGAIYSNQQRIFTDRDLKKGEYLRIHLQPKPFPTAEIDWRGTIVGDESDYLVVRKPALVPVHGTVDNAVENALHCLREVTGYPLYVTQRLDVQVAGLMVFAKTAAFQARFNQWLADRQVGKRYRARVEKEVSPGLKVHYMEPSERTPKMLSDQPKPGWQKCELTVLSCTPVAGDGFSLDIDLHTGRTHQIRAQLARLGAPVMGDRPYGSKSRCPTVRGAIGLCSVRVDFPAVGTRRVSYETTPDWETK